MKPVTAKKFLEAAKKSKVQNGKVKKAEIKQKNQQLKGPKEQAVKDLIRSSVAAEKVKAAPYIKQKGEKDTKKKKNKQNKKLDGLTQEEDEEKKEENNSGKILANGNAEKLKKAKKNKKLSTSEDDEEPKAKKPSILAKSKGN